MKRPLSLVTTVIFVVTPITAWSAPVTIFEPPGALATDPADINNVGQVVGFVADRPPSRAGDDFLRQPDGSFIPITSVTPSTGLSTTSMMQAKLLAQSVV